jgi:hypothetical protein
VPGEVLVRFREGVSAEGQQRAMMALRSKPSPSSLRWVGDVAVLSDPRELDATILAAQLNGQPEVASAEPNYLYRTNATPNDPGSPSASGTWRRSTCRASGISTQARTIR